MKPVIVCATTSEYLALAIQLLGRERVFESITLDAIAEAELKLEIKAPDLAQFGYDFADIHVEKEDIRPKPGFFGQNTSQSWKRRKK